MRGNFSSTQYTCSSPHTGTARRAQQRCDQDICRHQVLRSRPRHQMKITLFTWSGDRYRKSDMLDLFCPLLVEYDSSVDVADSVVINLFRSMSMIHSTSIRKRLLLALNWSVSTGCPFNSPNFNSPNSNYRVRVRDRVRDRVRVRVRDRDRVRDSVRRIEIRRIEKEPSTVVALIWEIYYSGHFSKTKTKTLGRKTKTSGFKTKTNTLKMRLETILRPRHVSRLPIPGAHHNNKIQWQQHG